MKYKSVKFEGHWAAKALPNDEAANVKCSDNFTNVLRQIETETEEDQKRQILLEKQLRALVQEPKRCENPLQYQLIPPRYLMKHTGYAVCRPCAEHCCRQQSLPQSLSTNLDLMVHHSKGNSPERTANEMSSGGCYLTVELGCCLARLTRLMFTSVKALKELQFVSGNMFPMLHNDIEYLNGLYLRMKSNFTDYRTMKMKYASQISESQTLTVGDVKILKKPVDPNDAVRCKLTVPEDNVCAEKDKQLQQPSRRASRSMTESDFEQYRTRKRRFRFDSKWRRDE